MDRSAKKRKVENESVTSLLQRIDDVTECPVCQEVLKQPKSLPCLHTFCLTCLEAVVKQCPGKVSCPVCRKESPIPKGGCSKFPTSFFVEKLLSVEGISRCDVSSVPCDLHSEDEGERSPRPGTSAADERRAALAGAAGRKHVAKQHCFDCHQNFCEPCCRMHLRTTVTKDHLLLALGRRLNPDQLKQLGGRGSFCERHKDEFIKLFCNDCKALICLVCFAGDHSMHDCSDIDAVLERQTPLLVSNKDDVSVLVKLGREELEHLDFEANYVARASSAAERAVTKKCKTIKDGIDRHAVLLTSQIRLSKHNRLTDIERRRTSVEGNILSLESFAKYSEELMTKGTKVDIVRESDALQARAEELLKIELGAGFSGLKDFSLEFVPGDSMEQSTANVIGTVLTVGMEPLERMRVAIPRPAIPKRPGSIEVAGVTTIDDELFIARSKCHEVEVYSIATYAFLRRIFVPGCSPCDMASLSKPPLLFISDADNHCVHMVDPRLVALAQPVNKWLFGADIPDGVSVADNGNVIVAFPSSQVIKEFNWDGKLVNEIELKPILRGQEAIKCRPYHALALAQSIAGPTIRYLVSYREPFGLIVINYRGCVLQRITPYSPVANPTHLAIDSKRNIYAAVGFGNAVLRMDEELQKVESFVGQDEGVIAPHRLHFDVKRGRLYVVEAMLDFRVWVRNVAEDATQP